jgi:hypothetical protein
MELDLPSEVLARIPEAARDRVCVCAACARGESAADESRGAHASRPLRTVAR